MNDELQCPDLPVANYEEVETSSVDSSVQSTVLLGVLLSIPLKHPYTPSLTDESPLHGQPRLFSDEDYIVPPDLNYEALYSSTKSSCPKVICNSELVDPLTLSPSDLSSPLKPVRDVVLCASYSPGRPTGLATSSRTGSSQSCFVSSPSSIIHFIILFLRTYYPR